MSRTEMHTLLMGAIEGEITYLVSQRVNLV